MAEYQRIVSYLYEYSNGMKGENVGFAKIEKRQKQLRLYFHVKTNDEALTYKIYFYRFRHGTMEGILLDSFQRNDTIIEFKNTYPLVVDLDQVDGFLIYHSNSHFFGSEWDDKPITIRNFLPTEDMAEKPEAVQAEENKEPEAPVLETQEPPEPAPEESIPESGPVQNPAPSDKEVPEEDEEELPSSAPEPPPIEDPFDELPQEIPIPAGTPETESTVPEPAPEPAGQPPRVYVEPEVPETEPVSAESLNEEEPSKEETAGQQEERTADPDSKLAEYIEALQLEKKAKEQGMPNTPSLFDWKEYPTLPLPPSYMLDPSIKIKVDDLQNIPHVPENMKTNGFLLLNYGNYGHLMLCQHRQTGSIWAFQAFLTMKKISSQNFLDSEIS